MLEIEIPMDKVPEVLPVFSALYASEEISYCLRSLFDGVRSQEYSIENVLCAVRLVQDASKRRTAFSEKHHHINGIRVSDFIDCVYESIREFEESTEEINIDTLERRALSRYSSMSL